MTGDHARINSRSQIKIGSEDCYQKVFVDHQCGHHRSFSQTRPILVLICPIYLHLRKRFSMAYIFQKDQAFISLLNRCSLQTSMHVLL